jgi:hypothetical protein
MVFALPETTDLRPAVLLDLFGHRASDDAETALARLLDGHARALLLPACAAVVEQPLAGDAVCHDLLTILAVLAKSSAHVYLRDKEPNLQTLRPGRRVVLILP